ncbi:4-hydroxy-tetrahydrodipicolinate synthase [Rhodoferax mekongensis]|uniref:4-hydroxy-tetrahydrodipicolinate synthase n=1 Tax=Rhodoferax mekongensis TaxID=3068341 RepID=UPI0028BF06D7|nr:4-hydroxy-tetrahydrodipicolinate synthase [Rhodoferax sp. TBRC 17199]MDT7515295.1 4-hydroxy-tetrahydrodipicolinate synthase [Rhodoferax sp. TBRC 17199]
MRELTPDFSGLWIPLVTPFERGAVDHPALYRLVRQLANQGVAGFVVCGSTGEAAAISPEEQLAVLDTVRSAAGGLPLVMGLSGYHLPETLEWVRTLNSRGLHGILVPAPHYIRPSQTGLIQWFEAIANVSTLPVVIYDIPARTGSTLALETLRILAQHPRIMAIKDCGADDIKTQHLIADGTLQVLAGDDSRIFNTVALGGAGAIAAGGHLHTQRMVHVIALLRAGELQTARALWRPLLPLLNALFAEPNPGPLKALMARQGLLLNELRAPMDAASEGLTARLQELSDGIPALVAQTHVA